MRAPAPGEAQARLHLLSGRAYIALSTGATNVQTITAGAFIGPAQVVARIMEVSVLNRFQPLVTTRLACVTHPLGAIVIALFGGGAANAFAIFQGAGNGILTIACGTLPLAIFGPENYGYP